MPKQIDVKVTKPQNKRGQGRTRKCPIVVLCTCTCSSLFNVTMCLSDGTTSMNLHRDS